MGDSPQLSAGATELALCGNLVVDRVVRVIDFWVLTDLRYAVSVGHGQTEKSVAVMAWAFRHQLQSSSCQ